MKIDAFFWLFEGVFAGNMQEVLLVDVTWMLVL